MKKHFIPMLVLFTFMMTLQSENILADHAHNEDWEYETRWHKNGKVWGVDQYAYDDDIPHQMDTSVRTSTTQDSWTHMMYAEAYFKSRYEDPDLIGDYYIHAKLNAEWATDQPPFEDKGEIVGQKGGMDTIQGSQADTDWFAVYDPLETIKLTDAFVRAKVAPSDKDVWYRASSKSYFTPKPEHIIYKPKDPYKDDDENEAENEAENVAPSPGLSPVNNSYYAYPGETHEAKVITSEPYYYIYWYIATPDGLETLVKTDEGWSTGTETEASMSYTFPSDAVSGEWTISAVSKRYSNLSEGSTRSYTLTVY